MAERKPLVAGNWKMNGLRADGLALARALAERARQPHRCELLVCPPATLLIAVGEALAGSGVGLGGQDCHPEPKGAFTGDISAEMLKDAGCSHAIVGHSERRALYREDDALVARKFVAAQAGGLTPILCIGETLDEREGGITEAVVGRQLDAVLALAGVAAFARALVAYEPVWAIGTGKTATPDQAQQVHRFIRDRIGARDAIIGGAVRLLYGGSVKAANAAELFAKPDVDGGLVGGASLKADEFIRICAAAA